MNLFLKNWNYVNEGRRAFSLKCILSTVKSAFLGLKTTLFLSSCHSWRRSTLIRPQCMKSTRQNCPAFLAGRRSGQARTLISYLAVRELRISGADVVARRMNIDRSSVSRALGRVQADPVLKNMSKALLYHLYPECITTK